MVANLEFNFITLTELFEKLKETPEGQNTNMFGQYNSKLMKEIYSLLKVLDKKNLNMADIGKELSHLVNFEG